ncbi:MAG: four helix bundle protein [Flavobacteriaceae bacterium]
MRNFRELDIWNESIKLVGKVYILTQTLPDTEKFGLVSQMNRCAVSIPSNIAEGCSKESQKDFIRFLQMALGSAFELETQFEICFELMLLERENTNEVVSEIITLQKRIKSLANYAKTQ